MEAPPNRPRQPSSHGYRLPVVEARHPGWEPTDPPPAAPQSEGPGVRVELTEKGFDARVRGGIRRFAPWLMPLVISALGGLGGGILGYYEGLKRAAARVAALEMQIDAEKELLRMQGKDVDRLFVLERDHEKRLLTTERQLKIDVVTAEPKP